MDKIRYTSGSFTTFINDSRKFVKRLQDAANEVLGYELDIISVDVRGNVKTEKIYSIEVTDSFFRIQDLETYIIQNWEDVEVMGFLESGNNTTILEISIYEESF